MMSDKKLRSALIRLAHEKPELRGDLLPILKEGAVKGMSPWEFGQFLAYMQGKTDVLVLKSLRRLLRKKQPISESSVADALLRYEDALPLEVERVKEQFRRLIGKFGEPGNPEPLYRLGARTRRLLDPDEALGRMDEIMRQGEDYDPWAVARDVAKYFEKRYGFEAEVHRSEGGGDGPEIGIQDPKIEDYVAYLNAVYEWDRWDITTTVGGRVHGVETKENPSARELIKSMETAAKRTLLR